MFYAQNIETWSINNFYLLNIAYLFMYCFLWPHFTFSLEESAKVLGKSVKEESVQVIEKKYGKESGKVFDDSLTSAGNATMTYMNIQSLGVKGLVKKTAKNTGKELGKAVLEAHATGKNN